MLSTGEACFTWSENYSLCHHVQTGTGAHPATYAVGTGGFPPGVDRPGRRADNSPDIMQRLRMRGAIPPLPNTSSWPYA